MSVRTLAWTVAFFLLDSSVRHPLLISIAAAYLAFAKRGDSAHVWLRTDNGQ
jgi:hypothetical protein